MQQDPVHVQAHASLKKVSVTFPTVQLLHPMVYRV